MTTATVLDLFKAAAATNMRGRLVLSQTGWLLLEVPNPVGRGVFAALDAPGIELPVNDVTGKYQAHISVMTPEEVQQVGGSAAIGERGRDFSYTLGKVESFVPASWQDMSRCWAISVRSVELEKLRKTYGLSPRPKYPFHITCAVRRKYVLGANSVSKSDGQQPKNAEKPQIRRFELLDTPGTHLVKSNSVLDLFEEVRHGNDEFRAGGRSRETVGSISDEGQAVSACAVPDVGASKSAAGRNGSGKNGSCNSARAVAGTGRRGEVGNTEEDFTLGAGSRHSVNAAVVSHVSPAVFDSCVLGNVKQGQATLLKTIAREVKHIVAPVSEAQADAGNYQKGHVNMHGLRISIETKKGDKRRPEWPALKHHYGYIRRTTGADGDHVDVFIGESPDTELVFIVDQIDPATKKFDELKCMCGFNTLREAKEAYLSNYEKNWKGLGKITSLTMQQFKEWLKHGSQKRPISTQTFNVKKAADSDKDDKSDESDETCSQEQKDSKPGILIIHRRTAVQFVTPDQPRDQKGRCKKHDILKALEDAFDEGAL